MKFIILIILALSVNLPALEFIDLVGKFKFDINELPDKVNIAEIEEFKTTVLKFNGNSSLDIVSNDGSILGTYKISIVPMGGEHLVLHCRSEVKNGNYLNMLISINKFNSIYLFTINGHDMIFRKID